MAHGPKPGGSSTWRQTIEARNRSSGMSHHSAVNGCLPRAAASNLRRAGAIPMQSTVGLCKGLKPDATALPPDSATLSKPSPASIREIAEHFLPAHAAPPAIRVVGSAAPCWRHGAGGRLNGGWMAARATQAGRPDAYVSQRRWPQSHHMPRLMPSILPALRPAASQARMAMASAMSSGRATRAHRHQRTDRRWQLGRHGRTHQDPASSRSRGRRARPIHAPGRPLESLQATVRRVIPQLTSRPARQVSRQRVSCSKGSCCLTRMTVQGASIATLIGTVATTRCICRPWVAAPMTIMLT